MPLLKMNCAGPRMPSTQTCPGDYQFGGHTLDIAKPFTPLARNGTLLPNGTAIPPSSNPES